MPLIEVGIKNQDISREIECIKERVRDKSISIIIPPSEFLADERVFPFLGPWLFKF